MNDDDKLLAFFAANASLEDTNRQQEYEPFSEEDKKKLFSGSYSYYNPTPIHSLPILRFRHAKEMLEKWKEFCNL